MRRLLLTLAGHAVAAGITITGKVSTKLAGVLGLTSPEPLAVCLTLTRIHRPLTVPTPLFSPTNAPPVSDTKTDVLSVESVRAGESVAVQRQEFRRAAPATLSITSRP